MSWVQTAVLLHSDLFVAIQNRFSSSIVMGKIANFTKSKTATLHD